MSARSRRWVEVGWPPDDFSATLFSNLKSTLLPPGYTGLPWIVAQPLGHDSRESGEASAPRDLVEKGG